MVNSYTIGLVEIKVQTSVWKLLTLLIIWSIISVHAQIFTSLGHAILFTCSAGGKQSKFFITVFLRKTSHFLCHYMQTKGSLLPSLFQEIASTHSRKGRLLIINHALPTTKYILLYFAYS